jgi:hypothetical protein
MSGEGKHPVLALTSETSAARLELVIEDPDLRRCRAVLSNHRGYEIWRESGLSPTPVDGGAVLTVEIPAARLRGPFYTLVLEAEPSGARKGTYYFEVATSSHPGP